MPSRRYTIVVADRTSGVVRRATISVRPVAITVCRSPCDPNLDRSWRRVERAPRHGRPAWPATRPSRSRTPATAPRPKQLAGQIESLQSAIADLGGRSALDPNLSRAMDKLPALVKARAMGGSPDRRTGPPARRLSALTVPDDTFGLLRGLLESLESRLHVVRRDVDRRNALAAATPSIWPAHGWLSSTVGPRQDPMTGGADYHSGPRYRRRARPAGLRDGGGHGQTARLPGRVRQPGRHRSRLRSRDAVRPPAQVRRRSKARRSSAATSSATSAPPAAPPAITSTTRCSPTAGSSIRCSCSRRSRATANSPQSSAFPCRSCPTWHNR